MYEFCLIDVKTNKPIKFWWGNHKERKDIRRAAFIAAYEDSAINGNRSYKIEQRLTSYL